jgi:hypothetical protein
MERKSKFWIPGIPEQPNDQEKNVKGLDMRQKSDEIFDESSEESASTRTEQDKLNGATIAKFIREERLIQPYEIISEYQMRGGKLESCPKCYCKGIVHGTFCDCRAGQLLVEANICPVCFNSGMVEETEPQYANSIYGKIQTMVYRQKRCGCRG